MALVVVHWNQPERCAATVAAFLAQDVPLTVTVVDNGSSDAARGALRRSLPADVPVVELGANRGFGPAANAGLRRWLADDAGGEWAALAPHDALPAPGCLRRLLDVVAERPGAGLASATFDAPGLPVVDPYFGGILAPSEQRPGWEPAGHPHGTLMLLRRACVDSVGLFDERYFAYCEEADLGERARRAGWEVGVVWGAVVANPSLNGTVPVVDYLQLRNSLLLVRTHFGRYRAFIRVCFALASTARGVLRPQSRPPFFSVPARRRALADFLRGRYGPPPEAVTAL